MTTSTENDLIRQRYNQFAEDYNSCLSERFAEWIFIGNLRKKLLSQTKGRVLEIGIGNGRNLSYYLLECQVTGIDISERMIELAHKDKHYKTINPKILLGNAEEISFEDNSFDCVVDCFGLCTYPNPKVVLVEMARVCKDKGLILLLEHGISSNPFLARLQRLREKSHFEKLCCNQTRDINRLVRDSSLGIIYERRYMLGTIYEYVLSK